MMKRSDEVKWAKEMVLGFIDDGIKDWRETELVINADIRNELTKQRNRIARYLGLEESDPFRSTP